MKLIRLIAALLTLGASACSSMQGEMTWVAQSPLIDQPDGYPYNSRFCP